MQRYGQTGASAYGLLDNLTFTLNGNQLSRVDDAVSTVASVSYTHLDPKDPKRKNNINPKDIPAEKGTQRMKELLQKADLNIPVSQREHIHWVF